MTAFDRFTAGWADERRERFRRHLETTTGLPVGYLTHYEIVGIFRRP